MKKSNTLLMVLLALISAKAFSQMNSFLFPPDNFNVTSSPATVSPVSGLNQNYFYFMSTGIRDYSNNLRFYIIDNVVYDGTTHMSVSFLHGSQGQQSGFSPEITIVPIPGGCHNKFYAFYSMSFCNGNNPGTGDYEVDYVTIDCSGPSVTVSSPTQLYHLSSGGNAGLACSKLIGTGNSAYHYLYFGEGLNGIFVSKITATGVTSPQNIGFGFSGNSGTVPKELELSENGEWLAFNASWNANGGGGVASRVSVIQLNPSNYPNQFVNYTEYAYYDCKGIEFVGSGTPDLYVCGKGTGAQPVNQPAFFDRIDVVNQTITNILQTPSFQSSNASAGGFLNFDNTFIEYSKSGKVCGFCDNGNGQVYFVEYDVNAQTVHGTPVSVSPSANYASVNLCSYHPAGGSWDALDGTYYMPDQIDGFDYGTIGLSQSNLYILTINGNPVSSECGEWTEVYNCNPILLPEKLFDNIPCGSTITISAYDKDCNPVYGSNYFNYSGTLVLNEDGFVTNRDLKAYKYFDMGHEYSLATMPGYYGISIDFIDCCSKQRVHLQAYVRVLGTITPTFNMQMYDFQTAPSNAYTAVSHSINSPVDVGTASLGFSVNATNGNISQANVLVQEVDNTGAVVTTNPNGGTIINETDNYTNTGSITVNLNSYCAPNMLWTVTPTGIPCSTNIPSHRNYFSDHGAALAGKYYMLTVTISNPCSSASEWTYMRVDQTYPSDRPAATTGNGENQLYNADAMIYPNPTAGEMNINISNNVDDVYTIELFDVVGQKVATLYSQLSLEAGNQSISTNVSALQAGTYFWKISSRSFSKSGKICITK